MRLKLTAILSMFLAYSICFSFYAQAKQVDYPMDMEAFSAEVIIVGKVKDAKSVCKKLGKSGEVCLVKVLVEEVIRDGGTMQALGPSVFYSAPKREIKKDSLIQVVIRDFNDRHAASFEKGEYVLLFLMPLSPEHSWWLNSEEGDRNVYNLLSIHGGNKYTAQNKEGLRELVDQTKYFISERSQCFDRTITFNDILVKGKHLWTATNRGIFVFDKETGDIVNHHTPKGTTTGQGHYWYQSLAIDKSGNIWLGSYAELAKFNGDNWKVFLVPDELRDISDIVAHGGKVRPRFVDKIFGVDNGVVWGGGRGYQGYKNFTFDEKSGRWEIAESIPDNIVDHKIERLFDSYGRVVNFALKWRGNDYQLPRSETYTLGYRPSYIILSDGTLWTVLWEHTSIQGDSFAGFLAKYNLHRDKDWRIYSWRRDGFAEKDVSCFAADSDGTIYLGGSRGSLFKFDGKHFTPIPTMRNKKGIAER